MSHDSPLVIAHRATMGHAPENTLLGIRTAMQMGCDGVEIDVQLSADGAPLLHHDDLLDRTTDATGPVAARTLAELQSVDAGRGEPIPTLREALALINGQLLFVIELKVSPMADVAALSEAVLREVDHADALAWCWLWSFDPAAVIELAEHAPPERRIAHLCAQPTAEVWQVISEHRLDGISMHHSTLNASVAATARAHGLAAFIWTANEPPDIQRGVDLGATGIVGDYPERIRALVG